MTAPVSDPDLHLVPADVRPAVLEGLRTAFPCQRLDALELVSGGFSGALVLKATLGGQAHLLRVERTHDALHDPVRAYACMRIAADEDLSPRVSFEDAAAGVAIMDWVELRPLGAYPGGAGAILPEAAGMVRRLQAGPSFPRLVDWFDGIDGLFAQLQASGLFTASALDPAVRAYAAVKAAYPRLPPSAWVASHNDLNPANILYDGRRLWFVDWETGFANDPHVDPAILALWFTLDEAGETDLLTQVFGEATETRRARLWLMRRVCSVFYGALSLLLASGSRPAGSERDLHAPDFAAIRGELAAGRLDLGTAEGALPFGKRLLAEVAESVDDPRFAWAAGLLAAEKRPVV